MVGNQYQSNIVINLLIYHPWITPAIKTQSMDHLKHFFRQPAEGMRSTQLANKLSNHFFFFFFLGGGGGRGGGWGVNSIEFDYELSAD